MTTSRLLLAAALLAALAACELGGGETRTGAASTCFPVAAACSASSDCCSYGCLSGVCVANPTEGGACRTTNDCASARLCKSGACTTATVGMCRDNADVCSSYAQCCSGNCEGGACTQNRAPIANAGPADVPNVPYTQPYTLRNLSTDPDGDPISYGWAFVSVPTGSAAALSSAAAATPTFTPDKVGAYVVRLVVTDDPPGAPNRLTSETTVTIHAENLPPEPTATAAGATCQAAGGALSCSRNNALRISATASDRDGDALDCAWQVTEPGATQPTVLADVASCANPSSSFVDYTPTGEGTYLVEHVVRDHDRTTGAVVHVVPAAATVVSRNDPPVPVLSRSPYHANLGIASDPTPPVALDASASTDPNGDQLIPPGPLSFFWEMVAWPGSTDPSPPAAPVIGGFSTATPTFVPAAEGSYVLNLTVSDAAQFNRASASTSVQVTVEVGHYVQPLGHSVADAARAVGTDKIVLAGIDPSDSTKGMIWVYDMATGTEATGIRLVDPADGTSSGIPRLVDVSPNGTKVVVVDESVSIWIVTLGTTPSMLRVLRPFAIGDLVAASDRAAFLFKSGGDDYMRELDLGNGTISQPAGAGYAGVGASGQSGTTNLLYRFDTYWNDWYRYTVNNSGGISQTAYVWSDGPSCGGFPATGLWGTLTGSYVVSSCGTVYSGSTLADLGTPLGRSPIHVDSTTGGALLVCEGSQLSRFGSTLQLAGTDVLPPWSQDGYGRATAASRAFFDGAGTKRFAVVHDDATPVRYGIVTFP